MKEERAVETLRKIKKILDKNNINYWLDEGSLLGAVREKKLIEWDHDIDLSIWYTDLEKIRPLFNEINNTGVQAWFLEGQKHLNLVGKGYKIDINLYHLKDHQAMRIWYTHDNLGRILDYFIWTLNIKNAELINSKMPLLITKSLITLSNKLPNSMKMKINQNLLKIYKNKFCKHIKMAVPSHFFTDLSTLEFYGMNFRVPKKTEEYLEYRYGKNWRIPKKDYVFHRDDNSIVKR
jgi:phosphorylcholine metabolism protein LicD